jgi:hypothetical protein
MFNQLDPAVVRHCGFIAQQETLTLIDDRTAKKIADAYTWSWITCWFAGEGEIGHEVMGEAFNLDPAGSLMHAMFGWWHRSADTPDGTEYGPDEVHVVTAMQNYLFDRVRRGALGPIEGWRLM